MKSIPTLPRVGFVTLNFSPNIGIILDKNKADTEFFYYFFYNAKLAKYAKQTTQANLTAEIIKNLDVTLPPLSEQRKIAEILSTVDFAIQKVNEAIVKTERLKKGLVQELLTKGIGHKEFKFSKELSCEIPKDWGVVKLGDAVEIDRESKDPAREMPNETLLYVDIDSIEGGTGKIRIPKRILGKKAPSRARRVIHENDVIMSTVRPYLKAFAIVPKEYDNQICSTGFAVLSCEDTIFPYFLLSVLFFGRFFGQIILIRKE